MKLELEGLTDRILLSASPVVSFTSPPAQPAVAEVTSQLASTMDQWANLIVTLQNDLNNAWQTMVQEMAKEVASFQQQWDGFLGNNPNEQNQSTAPAAQPLGGGTGATMMAPEVTATPPSLPKAQTHLSGSPYIVQPNNYVWDPANPLMDDTAGNPVNWILNGQHQKAGGTTPGYQATDTVAFAPDDPDITDGNGNAPIIWNYNATFSTMNLGGTNAAYTGLQTIQTQNNVDLTGVNGAGALNEPVASSYLNLQFNDHNQVFEIDNNATITNMNVAGYSDDTLLITGGTTTIAAAPGFTENLGVSLEIEANGTLNDGGWNPLTLTSDDLTITVIGPMNVEYGTGSGITLIDSGTHQGDYIHVGGDLTYLGSGNVTNDTFTVPVYVFGNTGVFTLKSAPGQPNGGKLTVKDQSNYVFPNGSKYSVFMNDAGDQVLLTQGGWLRCADNYYQGNGFLVSDNTPCTLGSGSSGANGTVTIAGGEVSIDNVPKTYNTLSVSANTLQLAGELDVSMDASNPGTCDVLHVNGTVKLQLGATLSVLVDNGPPMPKKTWTIILDDTAAHTIQGNFAKITTFPDTKLTGTVDSFQYILTS